MALLAFPGDRSVNILPLPDFKLLIGFWKTGNIPEVFVSPYSLYSCQEISANFLKIPRKRGNFDYSSRKSDGNKLAVRDFCPHGSRRHGGFSSRRIVVLCLFPDKEMTMIQLTEADLASPAFKANPYPTFAWLRTHDPVHQFTSPDGQSVWLVTRHQDAEFVLRDEHFTKDRRKVCPPEVDTPIPGSLADLIDTGMLRLDPPEHMRLRSLVSFSFTPRLVEEWRGGPQENTKEMIVTPAGEGSTGPGEGGYFSPPLPLLARRSHRHGDAPIGSARAYAFTLAGQLLFHSPFGRRVAGAHSRDHE